jgi:ribose transport system substrate-binding protein
MRKHKLQVILLIAIVLVLAACQAEVAEDDGQITIGYVTKSATNQGWILINQGAADAAAEAGIPLITLGPAQQGSLEGQLSTIEDMTARGVDALAIAPVDSAGVAPAVEQAMEQGIPVVAIDTAVEGADVTSFVATDNLGAANMQGEWVAEHIADDGEIILVNGLVAQSTGRDRRDGFVEIIEAQMPGVTIYQVDTEWSQEQAQNGVEDLLQAHPDVSFIACAWDGGTMGAIAALQTLGYEPGDVTLVGFDGAPNALQAMRDGWVQANVAQQLYKMGYQGIEAAIAAANGEEVEARIDTGAFLVVPDNVEAFIEDNRLGAFMP